MPSATTCTFPSSWLLSTCWFLIAIAQTRSSSGEGESAGDEADLLKAQLAKFLAL